LSRGISNHGGAGRHMTCDHAARADHRVVADNDPREKDRSATNPDVATDPNGTTELESRLPLCGITRMVGRIDLHGRADLRPLANLNLDDIEDDAIEVEKCTCPELDVGAIIAKEGRTNLCAGPDAAEAFKQELAARGRQGYIL
jgi:hypothetical protein